ncbi:exodeoxyribonuclease VII large subunit [Methylomonas sp. LW13]|uniref:exodeoxyribonuclease VII large subunit n=1 Tax=unclassified Methylomonas TaxID=2608980 RepID=UPI00051C510C|nr:MULTISPECIES: exodeoxyribonuclease VII large subunit [unclassified Methylomonas]PKD40393.1 exodeoxyribonuclease VII large subunit [Methylomonas sp. Kb3]QBC27915.1 exodeoxyribonuclease VII large subunit [Methylomonas sp. LW13]
MSNSEQIFSVSQLNREAKRLLASHFLTVQVQGEISNLSLPSSGHYYFTLKDAQAQIRCAMFKGQQQRLRFKPANGNLVIATAQVSLYEPRGDYQLVVEQLEEAGDGALRLAYERLKQKLLLEGLFEQNRKKPLPPLPTQIGVITSASGAAIHDILSVLKRRFPAIPVLIYPVAVQGESAKFEISAALATANKQALVDVIILARGGGSLEDLWAFNEEIVARAIAASGIPVISAIGHEVDFSIADFVADLRAPTPSVAAECAVPDQSAWLNRFTAIERQLTRQMKDKLQQQQMHLSWLNKALQTQHPGEKLQRNAQRLDELEQRLNRATRAGLGLCRQRLVLNTQRLNGQQPLVSIHGYRQQLDYFQQRLSRSMQIKLTALKNRQHAISQTLHAISPLATLERGYAIVQRHESSQLVKSVKQLAKLELFDIRMADGRIVSRVDEVIPD